jgi:hypothetical protein
MTIEDLKKNKLITKADIKFIEEYILEQGDYKTFEGLRGENITCTGFLAGLIKFVFDIEPYLADNMRLQMYHDKLTKKNAINKFDRARHLILKLDSHAYMTLID